MFSPLVTRRAPPGACPHASITALVLLAGLGCAGVSPHASPDGGGVDATSDFGGTLPPIDATTLDLSFDSPPPSGDGGVCQRELRAVVRDFRSGVKDGLPIHPDFEGKVAIDPGIVGPQIGTDVKPIYAGGTQGTTTTKENFDQ